MLSESLTKLLNLERYTLQFVEFPRELIGAIEEHKEKIDCLIVLNQPSLLPLFNQLYEAGILLPVILLESTDNPTDSSEVATFWYHSAEVRLSLDELTTLPSIIDQAIKKFLHLGPNCSLSEKPLSPNKPVLTEDKQSFLLLQQRRLAEKLKERLGYLGVYYKRHPQCFYRNLSPKEKQELTAQLSLEYREIVLNYFTQDFPVNQAIDQFVNNTFFADISVSQILEIHMELMDEFSQQLKLEGRSEEILLDYRLVLIDILAHLGEMYRRSIPR